MRTNLLLSNLVVVAGLLLAACRKPAAAPIATAGTVPAGTQPGQLTGLAGCEYQPKSAKTKYLAECGTLTVSENWDKAGSRLIGLPVVRIPASGKDPAEPVFWLMGGPGGPNITWAPPAWLLAKHDVVMVGYRGVEGTQRLSCPALGRLLKAHVGKDLWSEQARTQYGDAVRKCAAGFQAAGVDLTGYTVPGVIADMEAARVALGYSKIDLFSESYGTRVAQLYAYLHPDSLHRVVQIGVNTPGHFIYDPAVLDQMIRYLAKLCARDVSCSSRTSDLAATMYAVDHSMPKRWLIFNIDSDSIRLGAHAQFSSSKNIAMVVDGYLSAAEGDPSGLALLNLMMQMMFPTDKVVYADYFTKGGTLDLDRYRGLESISLGNSIIGAPWSELVWPMGAEWPIELLPKELRGFQETDVDMLLVNGTIDFATPPTALDEAKPFWHKAQMVLLPEFSHTNDVYTLQPEAFQRLITGYYDTGVADSSLFVYQPVSFKPDSSPSVMAKELVAALILLPLLLVLSIVLVVRRMRRRRAGQNWVLQKRIAM